MSFTVHFYEEAPEGAEQAYAVIIARYHGKLLWCRHRERDTWEIPGGHIEPGESALQAAHRELQEETAASSYTLTPLCWYNLIFDNGHIGRASLLCTAEVTAFSPEGLHSEIAEIRSFDEPPANLTYPLIQPFLLKEAKRRNVLN